MNAVDVGSPVTGVPIARMLYSPRAASVEAVTRICMLGLSLALMTVVAGSMLMPLFALDVLNFNVTSCLK